MKRKTDFFMLIRLKRGRLVRSQVPDETSYTKHIERNALTRGKGLKQNIQGDRKAACLTCSHAKLMNEN